MDTLFILNEEIFSFPCIYHSFNSKWSRRTSTIQEWKLMLTRTEFDSRLHTEHSRMPYDTVGRGFLNQHLPDQHLSAGGRSSTNIFKHGGVVSQLLPKFWSSVAPKLLNQSLWNFDAHTVHRHSYNSLANFFRERGGGASATFFQHGGRGIKTLKSI